MTIREKIDALVKAGWSYRKLAKKICVSKTTISRWHKGECKPRRSFEMEVINHLCERAEINPLKFKVGDRVRICKGTDNWVLNFNLEIGDTGTIINIYDGLLYIDFDKTSTFDTSNNPQICPIEEDYIEKVEEREQPKHKFKVGDRVQFKSWKEMEEQFGLNNDGSIHCMCSFTEDMRYLCGTRATIRDVCAGGFVKLKNFTTKGETDWDYSTDMLKPAKKVDILQHSIFIKQVKPIREVIKLAEKKDHLKQDLDKEIAKLEKKLTELKAQKEKEKWKFTEDEKVILRNVDTKYKYIVRDADGFLKLSIFKPEKYEDKFLSAWSMDWHPFHYFAHKFKCIQWSDDEPCEFRKFI